MLLLLVADQQVQVGLSDSGDQFGAFQCQALSLLWIHNHQNAANSLHDRLPEHECLSLASL
ncbi:hypothetical protein D3C85_1861370 [compost metagenome]